jgi:2-C-methyl-D-erythritol 4-phosphate cytidylyltransferase
MIFAGILAGGKGERISNELPKQFISVCGKPVLYYSVQAFCRIDQVGKIIISCHRDYLDLAEQITGPLAVPGKITVVEGGDTRHQSLVNIVEYIRAKGFDAGDKIILHEAARPLIDSDVILDHITSLASFEATNTLFGAVDTMMISDNGQFIDEVPPKKHIYHGQTPQGYDLEELIRVLEEEITDDDLSNEIDFCALYMRKNRKVKIVHGNERLFKVTYPKDIELLRYYLHKEHAEP